MDEQTQAIEELTTLVKLPGALKIVTNIPNQKKSGEPSRVDNWVCHDVAEIEGPDAKGLMKAISVPYNAKDYGYDDRITHDECRGLPDALLKRLREHRE